MRLIDGEYLYNKFVANKCPDSLVLKMIKDEPTVNAIPIPENATNGDVIKTMFSNSETYFHEKHGLRDDHYSTIIGEDEVNCNICCDVDWWNAPYKGGKEE